MFDPQALMALTGFSVVSSITPGPNNLMLMTSGANYGLRRTLPHLLGVSIGFTLMVVLVGLGLAGLFHAYPVLHEVLRYLSIAYLLYLAWKIASSTKPIGPGEALGRPMTFLQAAAFQWVNPKAWTMAVTAVTVYAPAEDPLLSLIVTALVFGIVNLPCVGMWTLLGTQLRRYLGTPFRLRLFNWTAAGLLVATLIPVALE